MYSSFTRGYGDITLIPAGNYGDGYLELPIPSDLTDEVMTSHGAIYARVDATCGAVNNNTLDKNHPAGLRIQTLRYGDWNGGSNFGTYYWDKEFFIEKKSDVATKYPYIAETRTISFSPIELVMRKKPQGSTSGSTIRLKLAVADCNFDSTYRVNHYVSWVGAPL